VMAAAGGQPADAVIECDRAVTSGENPQSVILAVQRHFHRLERLRAGLDAGRSFDDAARALRPPLFFKQKDAMEAQCRIWTSEHLSRIRVRIAETARTARLQGELDAVLAERLLLEIATIARGRAAQRR
jgi:DNA polymerase III subunit delta